MKTDKFENTIRRKLESISPEFQESNWNSMQNYMEAQTPPNFWKRYSSQLSYAAAASVVLVSTLLYAYQVQKNNQLLSDVENLKSQIKTLQELPSLTTVDTVYVLSQERVAILDPNDLQQSHKTAITSHRTTNPKANDLAHSITKTAISDLPVAVNAGSIPTPISGDQYSKLDNSYAQNEETNTVEMNRLYGPNNLNEISLASIDSKNKSLTANPHDFRLKYQLANKLSPKQVNRILNPKQTASGINRANTLPKATDNRLAQVDKSESIIPVLPIKSAYRFGAGFQTESHIQIKNITAELPLGKRFSFSTGLSWLKAKPLVFINEKLFKDKNKMDFDEMRPKDNVYTKEIVNIKVKTSAVQVPLTVAFRSALNDKLDYYLNAGTNLTVSSKDQYNFDVSTMRPFQNIDYYEGSFERKNRLPLINSWNAGIGIEKAWQPIVIQIEGYLVNYFSTVTPETPKLSPGLKVKLLYQFGPKNNNTTRDFKSGGKI